MRPEKLLLFALLGAAALYLVPFANCARNVTISKCCHKDEILTNENKCTRSERTAWNIKVFSPAKRTYLPKNEIPPNWHLKEGYKPGCSRPALLTANLGNYVPFQNGSLFVVEYNKLVHPLNYCIDYDSVLICRLEEDDATRPQSMSSVVRVKKCCGKEAIFSITNQTCIRIKDPSYDIDLGQNVTLTAGFPQCNQHKVAFVGKVHEAKMQDNGSLWFVETKTMLPVGNYCLEHILENTGRSPTIVTCQEYLPLMIDSAKTVMANGSNPTLVLVEQTKTYDLRFTIYPIGLALSAVFLAATLVAGSLLPASHHVLHWKCQTNHVACLFVGDVLLCITHLSGKMASAPCFMIAVSMHFLFLAAFFWLNVMCFNIWWTFRDLRPQSVEKGQERCRLRLYEIYAWGVPLIFAGSAVILDLVPEFADFLRPKFGVNTCWFYGDMEILTFFYAPMGVLLVVNLIFFALTARELTCGLWKRELVKSTSERATLGRVCMKLVVVMGVTWIADVLSWIIGGPQELWYLTDLVNCLQGVLIFIVVGCQPQVLSAVKRLWCIRKHRENGVAGTNHHSSSSQGLPSLGDTTNSVTNTNNTTKSVPLETSC